jgi:hypothetical protein
MYKVLIYYHDDTELGFYLGSFLETKNKALADDIADFIAEDENVHHTEVERIEFDEDN